MKIKLIPAEKFTIQELTELYNKTRVDYLVPMPMNPDRLAEYIRDFDVDLAGSCVARADDGEVLGLGMLGVRENRAWITRLGVLPNTRRGGVGDALMDFMLEKADSLGFEETHLEVIKNNEPAHKLFLKKGFLETDEYLVLRRAPHAVTDPLVGKVKWLDKEKALDTLKTYPYHLTWINALNSMFNAPDVEGLRIRLPNGGTGWLVYRSQKFFFSHLIIHTEQGDPVEVGTQLLRHLYSQNPRKDTYAENIHEKDRHLSALKALAFFENFSRIEMRRQNHIKDSPMIYPTSYAITQPSGGHARVGSG
jgi:ribosomal protein S18 acetylase RimI-like enzyme